MPRLAVACVLWIGALASPPAAAQVAAPDPPGPYVIDVRGVTSAIPQDANFFPPVPTATIVPSRGYGIDVGAHVYLMRLGSGRLGIGGNVVRVRGTASPAAPSSGSIPATPAAAIRPDVRATLTTLAPQLSYNFGSAEGWSYVSAGLGRAQLRTGTSAFGGSGSTSSAMPARSVDSGTRSSINVGGGARWFAKAHLAFSFDVRFHLVSAGAEEGTAQATPRTTLVAASAGISVR
ncbi:MAG: hypothetical protein HYX77_08915 [Acidobacteria bacterium]|nr:hypothetical protein [Acidobacteriota bacterium]